MAFGARAAALALSSLLAMGAADCGPALRASRDQQRRLAEEAPRREVLLLGEIHTSAADHAWQLESLQTLWQAGVPLRLGLEMIPAARQGLLDRYGSGSLDEAAFLEQVGWAEVWGHDPALYLPLLRWARPSRSAVRWAAIPTCARPWSARCAVAWALSSAHCLTRARSSAIGV